MSAEGKATAAQVLPPGCSTAGEARGPVGGVALLLQRFRGTGTKFARGYTATKVQCLSRTRSDAVRYASW